MGEVTGSADGTAVRAKAALRTFLFVGVVAALLAQAWLALAMEINWDEFYFLSQIHEYQRGELTKALQTIHVHLFGWVTAAGDEIRQVEAGRLAMLLCEAATCALVYALARSFFSRTASLFAVLAYVCAGFTMVHGASFRTDPLAATLIMAVLALVARAPARWPVMVGAALAAAVGVLVTVKVIFFAPAIAGLAAWRWSNSVRRLQLLSWLAGMAACSLLLFGLLYWLHQHTLPSASVSGSQAMIESAGRTTLGGAGLLPRGNEIVRAILVAPVQTVLTILALGLIAAAIVRQKAHRMRLIAILGCVTPLLSLLFYRNAFPYFFPFITASAPLLLAWLVDEVPAVRARAGVLSLAMVLTAAFVAVQWALRGQSAQRHLVSNVHRVFPRPVAYIDRNSMIASFPKRGFFMSTWGMLEYHRAGKPVFEDVLRRDIVPLLIVNGPELEETTAEAGSMPTGRRLLEADRQLLRANFIRHWGRIWVAGQRHKTGPGGTTIRILVPGVYTVEGGPATIDGRALPDHATVDLSRGDHWLSSATERTVAVRWGNRLYRPMEPALAEPLYRGF
jgi:hypothetical protein